MIFVISVKYHLESPLLSLSLNTENYLVTTVGQLNFFKWIIENKIITYMQENIDKIETDMTENINKHYKSKKIDKRRKRKELL